MRKQLMSAKRGWMISAALIPLLLVDPASAAEIKALSAITAVTVFPQGAEVTRTSKIKLDGGENVILVQDLTGQAIETSIRVEGQATGKLEIGSVDTRRAPILSGDPAVLGSQRKRLEDEILKQKDARAVLDDVIRVEETQRAYLDNLSRLPTVAASGSATGPREDWNALFTTIGSRMADIVRVVTETKIKQRDIDKVITDLQRELANVGRADANRMEVRINAQAATPLEATLTVRYQVGGANWTPLYDARLETGDKATPPKLSIARRAQITQSTGEDWDDVTLALSTTRPGRATAAPDLAMLSVDFASDAAPLPASPPAPVASAPMSRGLGQAMKSGNLASEEASDRDELARKDGQTVAVTERRSDATIGAFQAVFDIPGRASVKKTGEAKRVEIARDQFEPALIVRTVPRFDTTAYLYAKLNLPKTASPLMPGQVALFRDGVFVGQGRLPQLSPGEEHELGFSSDDRVKVKRLVLEDKKGESGTFTTSRVEERNYAITVKNLHARPVQVAVIDRMPVSMHQDIKVDFTVKGTQPTKKDVNDKRGTFQWELKVEPDEEKQLAFGYKVTAPADKKIQYRELSQEDIQSNQKLRF